MPKKPSNAGKRWSPAEVKLLKELANGNTPTRLIALKLKRVCGRGSQGDAKRNLAQADESITVRDPWLSYPLIAYCQYFQRSEVRTMLDWIAERYKGNTTGTRHEIRIDPARDGSVMLWYLFWGEYQGVANHHHLGIARVRAEGDSYIVERYEGNCQEPFETRKFRDRESVFAIIDADIARK